MINSKLLCLLILLFVTSITFGQKVDKKVANWYNGKKFGLSTDLAYKKLLADKKSTTVVVAVIDAGVDIEHEDLKGKIWINSGEIAGNGIDDDKNGFIDDINGWNFLGNSKGDPLFNSSLEVTRVYVDLHKKYKGLAPSDIKKDETADYELYKEVKKIVEEERKSAKDKLEKQKETSDILKAADTKLKKHFKGSYSMSDLKTAQSKPELAKEASIMLNMKKKSGLTYKDYEEWLNQIHNVLNYYYNTEDDLRKNVIGDDASDFSQSNYGNNLVEGPDASHGTHVSGIITAVRNNGIGIDGVAKDVQIMALRSVPNGDEWDKDIALSVRYAVDNGAHIINMSFGKGYSPEQAEVISAFKYAEEQGVLVVHAAGNEGMDVDVENNFPKPQYKSMSSKFTNWIEVGASTRYKKAKYYKGYLLRDGLAADFSNYGKTMVDVFAPGHDICSTTPNNEYDVYAGTSMACPMVAGVAALIKSYYPKLTMIEIRGIIVSTVRKQEGVVTPLPGDPSKEATLGDLCNAAGIVNVYDALLKAEELSTK
ncbi:MAG: subtilisin family serine protease [Parvicellaceae bacterium]|jgi:subtilisin family serine protease